jgi:hypothetical protein
MKAVINLLEAADPIRHGGGATDHHRARLRQAILSARSSSDAQVPSHVRRRTVLAIVAGSLVIAAVLATSMKFAGVPVLQAAVRFEVRLAEDEAGPGLRAARVANSPRTVYLHPEVVVTNDDIAQSSVIPGNQPSQFWIDVRLKAAGASRMRDATRNHLGKPVAILIDGDVVTAPTLKSPIGDAAVISGDYTQSDAQRIANGVRLF